MKKKLLAILLVTVFVGGFAQPSQSNAAEMLPRITSIQPGTATLSS
ncbi:MAG: hypothetical protein WBB47_12690 [Paenisporosarcina sp.]|jgi:hypothetical protein